LVWKTCGSGVKISEINDTLLSQKKGPQRLHKAIIVRGI